MAAQPDIANRDDSARGVSERSFGGFRPLEANFTPTPNAFFDYVLGSYPLRVVTVVGILIRSTLGWRDEVTGEKRVEVELALPDFIRPQLSESSARIGLREAIEAGFIVETATHSNKAATRYALRWADDKALRAAVQKQRRANGDTRPLALEDDPKDAEGVEIRGVDSKPLKNRPPKSQGLNPTPPIDKERFPKKKPFVVKQTDSLNVTGDGSDGGKTVNDSDSDIHKSLVVPAVREVIALTGDRKSAGRFVQLREICLQNNVMGCWDLAEMALRERLAKRGGKRVEKPGAWFATVIVREMEKREVFVPTKAEESERDSIRGLIAASLAEGDTD